jgi:hypothetical protein
MRRFSEMALTLIMALIFLALSGALAAQRQELSTLTSIVPSPLFAPFELPTARHGSPCAEPAAPPAGMVVLLFPSQQESDLSTGRPRVGELWL